MAILAEDILATAEELLASAESLPDIPRREALCRAVVGRAYYAAYHQAIALARRQGYVSPPPGYASHEGLWEWWFAEQRDDLDLAADANALKSLRHRADYRLRETFGPGGAREAIEAAKEIFNRIDFL